MDSYPPSSIKARNVVSIASIVLRFEVQEGLVVLPKSTKPARIKSNLDIFGFELTDAEVDGIRALDTGKGTHDPEDTSNVDRLLAFKVHD